MVRRAADAATLEARRAYIRQARADLAEHNPGLFLALAVETTCRRGGCSDSLACPGGCHWTAPRLCSSCAAESHSARAPP